MHACVRERPIAFPEANVLQEDTQETRAGIGVRCAAL